MALIHGRAAGRPPLNLRGLFDRCRKNGPRCAACSNWLGEGGRPGWHIPPTETQGCGEIAEDGNRAVLPNQKRRLSHLFRDHFGIRA
jgi:hypothetical protein